LTSASDAFFESVALPDQQPWHTYHGSVFNLLHRQPRDFIRLANVQILGDLSLITDGDGQLVEAGIDEVFYWSPRPFPFAILSNEAAAATLIEERLHHLRLLSMLYRKYFGYQHIAHPSCQGIYLCHPFGFYAFGHLHDTLQRLYPIRDQLHHPDIRFVVSAHEMITDFQEHLSILAGRPIKEEDLIVARSGEIHVFPDLLVPFSPAMPTTYTPATYRWLVPKYIRACLDFGVNEGLPAATEKLYLSRHHIQPGKRSVSNEEEVCHVLADQGFRVLTGREPLREVVRHFFQARLVLGPHGSLFAHTIYCRPEARIIEFCPDNRLDYSFRDKYKMAQNYAHIPMPADENHNLHIPLETLRNILQQAR